MTPGYMRASTRAPRASAASAAANRPRVSASFTASAWKVFQLSGRWAASDIAIIVSLVDSVEPLLTRLRALKTEELQTLKPYLTEPEIKGLLARRDKIVQIFDQLIKEKGEGTVLYDRPSR